MRKRRAVPAVPRRRRVGWTKFQRATRKVPFGLSQYRSAQADRKYLDGLSGIECGELEYLAGLPDDAPYELGELGGFLKKIKKAVKKVAKKVKKVVKKTATVVKKVVKSKAFKIAAIGAGAWFAGPAIVAKLAAKKGITVALAQAALKRGAQRLGKTGAVAIGTAAATEAPAAPEEAIDYEQILELGLQPEAQAIPKLATVYEDTETMAVPGEVGGPKLAGMGNIGALVIGGGLLVALMMGGTQRGGRRTTYRRRR